MIFTGQEVAFKSVRKEERFQTDVNRSRYKGNLTICSIMEGAIHDVREIYKYKKF